LNYQAISFHAFLSAHQANKKPGANNNRFSGGAWQEQKDALSPPLPEHNMVYIIYLIERNTSSKKIGKIIEFLAQPGH